MGHIADILTGAGNEKIKRWRHDTLTTYGAGRGKSKAEWLYYTRELVSNGLLRINQERFNVVEITPAGLQALKTREAVYLREPLLT